MFFFYIYILLYILVYQCTTELYTWYVSAEGDMTIPICKPPNKQCLD